MEAENFTLRVELVGPQGCGKTTAGARIRDALLRDPHLEIVRDSPTRELNGTEMFTLILRKNTDAII